MCTHESDDYKAKTGYVPSSWNYGSFHQSNPIYQKRQHRVDENKQVHKRASSTNPNGKRILNQDERIVTEEYLKCLNDNKAIRSSKDNRNKSNASIKIRIQHSHQSRCENDLRNELNESLGQETSKVLSSKSLKYQLSFDEWAAVKDKQREIYTKVHRIKEEEDKNFENFNKKIDQNYQLVKQQNFEEWLRRKQVESEEKEKAMKEKNEIKENKKQHKEMESQARLESWFKRQAEIMDHQKSEKIAKEKRKQEEKIKKQKEEEEKKAQAQEAFRIWLSRKKDFTKVNKTEEENKRSFRKLKTSPIVIGPYSYAKGLRSIQKNITINFKRDSADDGGQSGNKSDIELQKNNIEDSLQELSSIKKDTPIQENEQDYD